jgi:hypothetical protein
MMTRKAHQISVINAVNVIKPVNCVKSGGGADDEYDFEDFERFRTVLDTILSFYRSVWIL